MTAAPLLPRSIFQPEQGSNDVRARHPFRSEPSLEDSGNIAQRHGRAVIVIAADAFLGNPYCSPSGPGPLTSRRRARRLRTGTSGPCDQAQALSGGVKMAVG